MITIKGNTGNNIYPPAPIRDLILNDNIFKDNFNLSFTSPGEDLNSGTISDSGEKPYKSNDSYIRNALKKW